MESGEAPHRDTMRRLFFDYKKRYRGCTGDIGNPDMPAGFMKMGPGGAMDFRPLSRRLGDRPKQKPPIPTGGNPPESPE